MRTRGALLSLLALVSCTTTPEWQASFVAAGSAVRELGQRSLLPVVAVVGGVRRAGVNHAEIAAGHRDELADKLAHQIERALTRDGVRVVDHRNMPLAMDVLRLQVSDLFPTGDESDEAALGRFHQADVLVTAEYVLDADGHYVLDLEIIDVHTLEVLALGRAHSRTVFHRTWDESLKVAAIISTPVPVVIDMLRYSMRRSFGDESKSDWELLGGVLMFPIHLISSPFLSSWDTTRYWLDLDDKPSTPSAGEPEPG